MAPMTFDPFEDGITHVNVYSQSNVELGRLLSNFTLTPFFHPEYGHFDSMEGFYFYVSTGFMHQELRQGYGFKIKQIGKSYPRVKSDNFLEIIETGLRAKVNCNPNIKEALRRSSLPLAHYYTFGKEQGKVKVHIPHEHQWIVEIYEKIRNELKQEVLA